MNNLRKLAGLYGIETNYVDIHGNHIHVEDEVLIKMLGSFGEFSQNGSDWEENIHRKEEEIAFPIPPVIVSPNREITFIPQLNWLSGSLFFKRKDILLEIPFRIFHPAISLTERDVLLCLLVYLSNRRESRYW